MAVKIPSSLFLMSSKRAFSVASENIKAATATATATATTNEMKKVVESSVAREEVYWMRDPKTGNWMPENHFEDVDVAELRSKFLSKKPTSSSSN